MHGGCAVTSHDVDGLELAQAIDSLARVLSRASSRARQGESAFQVEPVELTLQVTAVRTGLGVDGIEWRVLELGDQAAVQKNMVHSLTIRINPRSPRQASGQGVLGQRPGQRVPGRGGQEQRRDTPAKPGVFSVRGGPVLPDVAGTPGGDYRPGGVRMPLVLERLRGRGAKGLESAAVGADKVIAVRVRYLDAGQSGRLGRLVIEQKIAAMPSIPESSELGRMLVEERQGQAGRQRLVEAAAEYVATGVDNRLIPPVTEQWEIQGALNPAAVSDALDRSQQWLQGLVQRPFESASVQLGAPSPVAGPIGAIGANVAIAPVARPVQDATVIIDIIGILIGTATGMHPLVMASIKHLAHTEFHRAVAQGVAQAFDGLLTGSIDEPYAPTRPHVTPRSPSSRPGPDDPTLAERAPPPSTPSRLAPPPPTSSPRPTPPRPSTPSPLAPPAPSPRRPAPGIPGPGGFG